jgi:hypothetical protein
MWGLQWEGQGKRLEPAGVCGGVRFFSDVRAVEKVVLSVLWR